MSVNIRLKHSSVQDRVPLTTDLQEGELALNINSASPAAYIKDSAGNIVKLAGSGSVSTPDATTTTKGIVQLADAAAVTAGTPGVVVDAAQLKVVADAVAAEDLWDRTGTTISPKNAGDVVEISAGTAALPGLTPVGDPNTGIYFPGADQVAISTNGTGRLFITADGKVGLGTSSPGNELVVNNATTGANTKLEIKQSGGGGGTSEILFSDNVEGRGRIYFDHGSSPEGIKFDTAGIFAAIIDTTGRLGIGTTSPQSPLHVIGADGAASLSLTGGATTAAVAQINAVSAAASVFTQLEIRAHEIAFDTAGTKKPASTAPAGC